MGLGAVFFIGFLGGVFYGVLLTIDHQRTQERKQRLRGATKVTPKEHKRRHKNV